MPELNDWVRKCAEVMYGLKLKEYPPCVFTMDGKPIVDETPTCIFGGGITFDPLGEGSNDAWRIVEKVQKLGHFQMGDYEGHMYIRALQADGCVHSVISYMVPDCLQPYGLKGLLVYAAVKLGGEE